ncbi:MAG TPA: polyphosphate kinase [Sphingomicrobium sp.]|nr:polyphosphate kinase [Sphingomicrobium sp.]
MHRVEDLHSALEALRDHLAELQLAQIAHGRRAIILFEGPDGSGKHYALKQLAAAFDPCHCAVHATRLDRRRSEEGHWLAPYWRALPAGGNTAIFYRSWYRRVLDERVHGQCDEELAARLFDEINEFEAQQRDYGTLIVKLYFAVSPAVQQQRLEQRSRSPWRRPGPADMPLIVDNPAYLRALAELRANSDTRWSPWKTIDGDDEPHAALLALEAIADAWAGAMPAEPPQPLEAPTRVA